MMKAWYIPAVENSLADAISRDGLMYCLICAPQVCHKPAKLNLIVVRNLLVLENLKDVGHLEEVVSHCV